MKDKIVSTENSGIEEVMIEQLKLIMQEVISNKDSNSLQERLKCLISCLQDYKNQLEKGTFRNSNYCKLLSRYIQLFTSPIVIVGDNKKVISGSCVFIELKEKFIITNNHVVQAWKDLQKAGNKVSFQIGSITIPLESLIIDFDRDLDLATIKIPIEYEDQIVYKQDKFFYKPAKWPYNNTTKDDIVTMAGYPGVLREDNNDFSNIYYASICESIEDVDKTKGVMVFDRDNWVKSLGLRSPSELDKVGGGFSGGPVFRFVDGEVELIGIVSENGGSFFDIMFAFSSYINKDGTIQHYS